MELTAQFSPQRYTVKVEKRLDAISARGTFAAAVIVRLHRLCRFGPLLGEALIVSWAYELARFAPIRAFWRYATATISTGGTIDAKTRSTKSADGSKGTAIPFGAFATASPWAPMSNAWTGRPVASASCVV